MTQARIRPAARAVLLLGALSGLLWWSAGPPAQLLRGLSGDLRESPSQQFDALLPEMAAAIAWLCLGWFAVVVALHFFGLGSSGLARVCQQLTHVVAPRFMRGSARWLVGVTLLAGPLASGVAMAAQVATGSASPSPVSAVANLDRPALPDLDRPVAPALPGAAAAATLAVPSSAPPASTPATPATPASPASPSGAPLRPVQSPAKSAPLVTGSPHRETTDAVGSYVVRRGDTLWDIAARHLGPRASASDIARAWPRWYAANQAAIGPNPELIHPGLVLHAPSG